MLEYELLHHRKPGFKGRPLFLGFPNSLAGLLWWKGLGCKTFFSVLFCGDTPGDAQESLWWCSGPYGMSVMELSWATGRASAVHAAYHSSPFSKTQKCISCSSAILIKRDQLRLVNFCDCFVDSFLFCKMYLGQRYSTVGRALSLHVAKGLIL